MKLQVYAAVFDDTYGTRVIAGTEATVMGAVRDWLFDEHIDAEKAAKELLDAPDGLDEIDYYDLLRTALDDPDVAVGTAELAYYHLDLCDSVTWDYTRINLPWTTPFRMIWAALRGKPVDI